MVKLKFDNIYVYVLSTYVGRYIVAGRFWTVEIFYSFTYNKYQI